MSKLVTRWEEKGDLKKLIDETNQIETKWHLTRSACFVDWKLQRRALTATCFVDWFIGELTK